MRLRRDQRGAALLEMAFTLPLLLLISVGIFEFGRAFEVWQVLTNAAREGARVAGFELCEVLGVVGDFLRQPRQDAPALGRSHLSPGAGQRASGGADGGVDIDVATARDRAEGLPVDRRKHRNSFAAGGSDPLTANEHAGHDWKASEIAL
jgi:hypothetical protein